MDRCEVLIVGGGPAGSTCAWKLSLAGVDVLVADAATFPRHKVCAGWITPPVIAELELDVEDYRRHRTFQPITGFRTGLIDGGDPVDTDYDGAVSFGIRRCEFDDYLLRRSRARLRTQWPVRNIRREGGRWIVNDEIQADVLVGAGGHFCPVAKWLNTPGRDLPLVTARETECAIDHGEAGAETEAQRPELYFSADLNGYGWCFRKQGYLNIGFGHLNGRSLPGATADFLKFLKTRRGISAAPDAAWQGHAYLVSNPPVRRAASAGALLVGDAAGLAYEESGEGIRPAIESGLMAAAALLTGGYSRSDEVFVQYERQLRSRFRRASQRSILSRALPGSVSRIIARQLFQVPWFVKRWLLDSAFLHASDAPLSL